MVKLSDSEICIMNIIWNKKRATSFDIIDIVKKNNKLSENTIRTLLARMTNKGAIRICEKQGKTYVYEPCINQNEFQKNKGNSFLEEIYQGAVNNMLLNFVKEKKLTKEDIKELLDKIDEM